MKKFAKKFLWVFSLLLAISITYSPPVSATTLNLSSGGDGWINGGFFSVDEMNPAGTGIIYPFVRLQATGSPADQLDQEGTNTLQTTVLDEKPHWISVFQIESDNLFYMDWDGQAYLNFLLDIDEPASKESAVLTDFILYTDVSDNKYPYPTQVSELMANEIWNMDDGPDGGSEVITNYNLIGGGSGWWGDLSVLVPISESEVGNYFYLYSAFTEMDNNPEEWSIVSNAAPVPEPATLLLLGAGLVGLAGVSRKKMKK